MDPHKAQPVIAAGAPLGEGRAVVILVHGRGAGPENILTLVPQLQRPDLSYLAPAAAGRTWYPLSFLADRDKNEPHLSSALAALGRLVDDITSRGVAPERIVLLGFSQGACLSSEFAVRNAVRYGGLIALSGGLIGPPGTTWTNPGSFAGMPAFFGCSDVDAHVPEARVNESADVLARMNARVTKRIYTGMGHVINDDEIAHARAILNDASS